MKNHFNGKIFIIFLFILGFDLYGIGHYITFILMPYLIITSAIKRYIDKESIILLLFSALYVMVLFFYPAVWQKIGIGKLISYFFLPFAAYISGKYIISLNNNSKIFVILLLFSMAIGILPIASVLFDMYSHGFIGGSRNIVLLNGVDTERSATGINGYIIMIASLIGLLMFHQNDKKEGFYKWLFISISVVSILCILRVGSRTGILIIATSLFCVLLYNLRKNNLIFYLFLSFTLLLFAVKFMSFSEPIFSYISMRSNEGNLDSAGSRIPLWIYYFTNLLNYPLGNIPSIFGYTPFAHNFWLDVGRLTGIFPLFFLIIFTFQALRIFLKFIRNADISPLFRNIVLVWHIAIYAVFFVEPIIEGLFSLFVFYCFLVGMLNRYYDQNCRNIPQKSKYDLLK